MSIVSNMFHLGEAPSATATLQQYKQRVQTVGVALLFAYLVNFGFQAFVTIAKKDEDDDNKKRILLKLLETSQIMYWFGIACMFSMVPPFFYGAYQAVMSFFTLIIVIVLHIACLVNKKIGKRSLYSLMQFFYHLFIFLWMLIGMILSFMWSQDVYNYITQ